MVIRIDLGSYFRIVFIIAKVANLLERLIDTMAMMIRFVKFLDVSLFLEFLLFVFFSASRWINMEAPKKSPVSNNKINHYVSVPKLYSKIRIAI